MVRKSGLSWPKMNLFMNDKASKPELGILVMLILSFAAFACSRTNSDSQSAPDPAKDVPEPAADVAPSKRTAVFAGGCFWCTEAVFEQLDGVTGVVSGYAGGTAASAKYDLVAGGATDHAEAIRITYDPAKISYGKLLKVFFTVAHDPTQLNRQGPDTGRHYRSAVFYADVEEKQVVESYIKQLAEAQVYSKPIVTTLEPLTEFYVAEDDHQDYVRLNPNQQYVVYNALPKVKKVREKYADQLR